MIFDSGKAKLSSSIQSIFIPQGHYFLFLSVKYAHFGWYVGLQKNGKAKKGSKTVYPPHQKAIEFVTKKQVCSFVEIPLHFLQFILLAISNLLVLVYDKAAHQVVLLYNSTQINIATQ